MCAHLNLIDNFIVSSIISQMLVEMKREMDSRFSSLERKFDRLMEQSNARENPISKNGEKENKLPFHLVNCRHLKERMRNSLISGIPVLKSNRTDWLEYLFGIRAPNHKIGKDGCRFALHTQHFEKYF